MKKATLQEIQPQADSSFNVFHCGPSHKPYIEFWHFHPEYEIVYIPHGHGRRFIGNTISRFDNGDLVILGPNIPHNCMGAGFESQGYEDYVVQFNGDKIRDLSAQFREFDTIKQLLRKSETGLVITDARIKHQIGKKIKTLTDLPPFERMLGLLEVLHHISSVKVQNLEARSYAIHGEVNKRITKVLELISEKYSTDITTTEVADQLGMTVGSFCRFFLKSTGKTFKQALTEMRIQNACQLLMTTDLPIGKIAYECGFNSLSLFNRLFKRTMNETPHNYRQLYSS